MTGLCIMTDRGWQPLGGPMQPVPPPKKWWRFATEGTWEALFREFETPTRYGSRKRG